MALSLLLLASLAGAQPADPVDAFDALTRRVAEAKALAPGESRLALDSALAASKAANEASIAHAKTASDAWWPLEKRLERLPSIDEAYARREAAVEEVGRELEDAARGVLEIRPKSKGGEFDHPEAETLHAEAAAKLDELWTAYWKLRDHLEAASIEREKAKAARTEARESEKSAATTAYSISELVGAVQRGLKSAAKAASAKAYRMSLDGAETLARDGAAKAASLRDAVQRFQGAKAAFEASHKAFSAKLLAIDAQVSLVETAPVAAASTASRGLQK